MCTRLVSKPWSPADPQAALVAFFKAMNGNHHWVVLCKLSVPGGHRLTFPLLATKDQSPPMLTFPQLSFIDRMRSKEPLNHIRTSERKEAMDVSPPCTQTAHIF